MSNASEEHPEVTAQERVLPASFAYIHCDVPANMTLPKWRVVRSRAHRAAENDARRERRAGRMARLRRCIGQP
jgi:hypothetical protein